MDSDGLKGAFRLQGECVEEVIGNAIHRRVAVPFLRRRFPAQPIRAEFSLGRDSEPTPEEMFDLAAKAVASGYRISRPELEEATGYALEGLQTPSEGGLPPFAGGVSAGYVDFGVAKPLQNARSAPRGENPIPEARTPLRGDFGHDAAGRALAADMEPLADRLRAILAQPEETWADAFAALAEEMPELLQDSDALAELMEEEMARAIANSSAQHCPNCGAFLNGDGSCSNPGCPDRGSTDGEKSEQAPVRNPSDPGTENPVIEVPKGIEYSELDFKNVGKTGDWQKFGLPAFADVTPDPPAEPDKTITKEAILKRVKDGVTAQSPLGHTITIGAKWTGHTSSAHKDDDEEIRLRYQMFNHAIETFEHPHEIWRDNKTGRVKYLRMAYVPLTPAERGSGAIPRRGIFAVDENGKALSWHTNRSKFDYYRNGTLLYLRPAQ